MEAEVARLQKENAKLKSDLRLKDKALATHQQSVRVYEDEIEALEKECTNKLVETQQQMAQLRMEKDADEKNFVQALELKETQVQALQSDLRTAQEAERRRTEEAEQLRAEIARAEESKDSLWTNAASASQQSEEIVASLRLELQEAQTSLSHAKREFADAKAKMYDRQTQLEKTNAELSTSVATLGRELAKAKASATALTPDGNAVGAVATAAAHAQMQDEYRKLQQTLVVMKKSLHDETRKNEIHVQEVQSLAYEVKRLKEQLVAAQDETAKQVLVLTKTNAELQEKLVDWETTASQQTASKDSEARIRTLTNRLIEKQESIDALRSKITTLDMRLADAQNRSETAENKLAQIERNGGVVAMDMEMGTSVAVGRKGGARVRSNRMAHTISRVAPVVERSARVVSALDGLDRWLLFLGRVFLSMPVARLALLCYVALIHFWVFMVLSFHTSHLNEEVHESPTGANTPGMFPDGMEVPP
jgi:chromosome segregation ATPase